MNLQPAVKRLLNLSRDAASDQDRVSSNRGGVVVRLGTDALLLC